MEKSHIINQYAMYFDGGDKKNGSLYLAVDLSVEPGTNIDLVIGKLRDAGCWSEEPPKQVPNEHKAAYEEQLELVEAVMFRDADSPFLATRFEHEKFPSDDERWQQWLLTLASNYRRQ